MESEVRTRRPRNSVDRQASQVQWPPPHRPHLVRAHRNAISDAGPDWAYSASPIAFAVLEARSQKLCSCVHACTNLRKNYAQRAAAESNFSIWNTKYVTVCPRRRQHMSTG